MSIKDRFAILDAIARYAYTFDGQDADGWTNVFTRDGVFEVYAHGSAEPSSRYTAHAELHGFAADSFSGRLAGARVRHYQTNTSFIELTSAAARTATMALITHLGPPDEQLRVTLTGVYEDEWLNENGTWKIARRTLRLDRK
jgi:hypothetical protein